MRVLFYAGVLIVTLTAALIVGQAGSSAGVASGLSPVAASSDSGGDGDGDDCGGSEFA